MDLRQLGRGKVHISLLAAMCASVFANLASAEGLDQLDVILNGPQDAAADAIQGADINGARPDIADVAGKGLCQSIATGTNREGDQGIAQAATDQLGMRCAELVFSADQETLDPDLLLQLGIGDAEIANALQQVVPEETEIMGSGATDTMHDQMNNVESRLQIIRTGSSTLPIAGIHINGQTLTGGAAGDGFSRLGIFINGDYGTGEKDATFNENGFDFDSYGITAGIDYRFGSNFVAGLAVGYSSSDVDVNQGFGSTEGEGINFTAYGTYFTDNYYIEASLTSGSYDYEGVREIDYGVGNARVQRTMASDTDGDQIAWSLGAGYNANKDALSYSYYGRFEGIDVDIDGYQERVTAANSTLADGSLNNDWAMRVLDQDVKSLRGVLGGQIAYALSKSFGVIQPYANLEFHHEFDDDSRVATAFYLNDPYFAVGDRTYAVNLTTDAPDENFFLLSLGTSILRAGGAQFFVNYDTLLGLSDVTSHKFTVGVRLEL